jgi:phenylalanyl-tRNA synthetase beta chain
VPEGKASLTFSVTYRSADRTLTQDEADARHQALLRCLEREVGATLRS